MINKKIEKAINEQINAELFSAYLYISMGAYFDSINLTGFSNWMKVQAKEEFGHAMKFYQYLNDRGGRIVMKAIAAPKTSWKSALDAFREVLKHEIKVTGLINRLVDLSISENDHATRAELQWFVTEQVEEEASADEIVQKLQLMKDAPGELFMLDKELAKRIFTPQPTEGNE